MKKSDDYKERGRKYVSRDLDDDFQDESSQDDINFEGDDEDYDENESVDFMGMNVGKDYEIEHENFKRYIRKSRRKQRNLIFFIIFLCVIIAGGMIFGFYVANTEKSTHEPFFADLLVPEKSHKLTDNLASIAANFTVAGYRAEVTQVEGYEYLRLTLNMDNQDVAFYFQNEFPSAGADNIPTLDKYYVQRGNERMTIDMEYGFDNIEAALPKIVDLQGGGQGLLYIEYQGSVPDTMTLYSVNSMKKVDGLNIGATFSYYFDVEDAGEEEFLINVIHDIDIMTYKLDENKYNEARGGGSSALKFYDGMEYSFDGYYFNFDCNVSIGEKAFIGEYKGRLIFDGEGIQLGNATYYAYVTPEYITEDAKILDPSEEIWENAVVYDNMLIKGYENIPISDFDDERLIYPEGKHRYYADEDGNDISVYGIDVSDHQGSIDWAAVAEQGVKYAIIRVGYRGYTAGSIEADENFLSNITGARAAGLDVGVYFYSQAVNEAEGKEEAEYVIEKIKDLGVNGPIVFDTELVEGDDGRANSLTRDERTKVARSFCDTVKNAGYEPMIYANTNWLLFRVNLDELSDVPIWYAYYGEYPILPYKFAIWQYSSEGSFTGVSSEFTDVNLMLEDVFK